MKSCNTIEELWAANKVQEHPDILAKGTMEQIVRSTVRRENKIIMGYFWISFTYQIMVYALMSHLIVRYWGDLRLMILALSGVVLYIPFTIVLMKQFKAMQRRTADKDTREVPDIYTNLKRKYKLLSDFFHFKKRFDLVAIPLSCFILIMVIFTLYVSGGIEAHPVAAILSYLVVMGMFAAATLAENKKRFINPIRKFEETLKEIAG